MSPEQVKLPVAPSAVQPVAPEPPARLTEVAVAAPGPMLRVPAAPAKFTVVAVALIKLKVVWLVVRSSALMARSSDRLILPPLESTVRSPSEARLKSV